ncbi:MAG: porin [Candidatus Brocadiales bacterium]
MSVENNLYCRRAFAEMNPLHLRNGEKGMKRLLLMVPLIVLALSSTTFAAQDPEIQYLIERLQALERTVEAQREEIAILQANQEKMRVTQEDAGNTIEEYKETDVAGSEPVSPSTVQAKEARNRGFFGDLRTTLESLGEWSERPEPMVKVGQGWLNIGGLFQEWWVHDELAKDEFKQRRMEIKFYGEIIPKLRYQVMFDTAKRFPRTTSDGSTLRDNTDTAGTLQDAFFTFTHIPHHELTLGQFKIPVIEEGFRSSSKLDFAERSRISRAYSDRRDIGIMLKGDYNFLEYYLALVNGEETNSRDLNDRKDYMARLVLKPFRGWEGSLLQGLEFGGSYYNGRRGENETLKQFWAAEVRYHWKKWTLKSEYVAARDDDSTRMTRGSIHRDGWYVQAGYRLFKPLEGLVRYEEFRNNRDIHGNENRDWTMGLNWFLQENHAKFQLNYVHRTTDGATDKANNQVIAAMQIHF